MASQNLAPLLLQKKLYRPVDYLGSDIVDASSLEGFSACLSVPKTDVSRHSEEAIDTLSKDHPLTFKGVIPFKCNAFEKVFLKLDKADLDEKED